MDTRRSPEPLTDAALDRELQRALAIDPSPEFVARVRTRIASEAAPGAWRLSWAMCCAGGAAAVAVIVYVAAMTHRTTIAVAPVTLASRDIPNALATTPNVATGPVAAASRQAVGPAKAGHYIPAVVPAFRRADPVPVFDARESRALQALIARVRGGTVDLTPLLKPAGPAPMELPPIDDIVIPPLSIEPIAPIDGAEGVRQ